MRRLLNPVLPAIPNIATPSAIPAIRPARPNPLRRRRRPDAGDDADLKPMPNPMSISPVKPPASRRKPAPTNLNLNLKPNPQPNPQAGRLFETARGAERAGECAGTI